MINYETARNEAGFDWYIGSSVYAFIELAGISLHEFNTNPKAGVEAYRGKYFDIVKTQTLGGELLISKTLLFIEPYAGVGYQKGKGEIDGSNIPGGDLLDLNLKPKVEQYHGFVGFSLKAWTL